MRKVAIIGASYLQLPLVKKAKEMNLETHCFAWEDGAVCKDCADFFYPISILEKEKIFEICREIKISGIVSIASDLAVPTISYVAEKLGLISNNFSDALICTDKYEMRRRLIENNVKCPKFSLIANEQQLSDFIFPVIVKPVDRSGSRGVCKVYNNYELKDSVFRAQKESFSGKVIVEEFIDGYEVSVETISWKGNHYILAITDKKTTGEPFFVEIEHHQPSQLPMHMIDRIKVETVRLLNALNINFGASHSEFIITKDDHIYSIEVGGRMGGDFIGSDLVRLSTGFDFVKAVVEVALGEFKEPQQFYKMHSGVYFLSAETRRILHVFKDDIQYDWLIESSISNEELQNVECSADRSGYLIYQADCKIIL